MNSAKRPARTVDALEIARVSELPAIATDADDRIRGCNSAAAEPLGCDLDHIAGRTFAQVYGREAQRLLPILSRSDTMIAAVAMYEIPSSEVRRIRRSLGLTQDQLAERLGVNKVTISRWETDKRKCRGEYAARLRNLAPQEELGKGTLRKDGVLTMHAGLRLPGLEVVQFTRDLTKTTRLISQLRPQLLEFESMIPTWWRQVEQLQQLQTRLMLPASYLKSLEDVGRSLEANPLGEGLSTLAERCSDLFESIQARQQEMAGQLASLSDLLPTYTDFSSRMLKSMVPAEVVAQSGEASKSALEVLLGPQVAFQNFANDQLRLVARSADLARRNRLELLDSSTQIFETMTNSLEFASMVGPLNLPDLTPRASNVFRVLDEELLDVDFSVEEFDADEVVSESRANQMAAHGRQLIEHVFLLNLEERRSGKPEVFKPSNRSFLAAATVVTTVATDECTFAHLVDQLYFLLYEGSGEAKRLCPESRDDLLAPLWQLKKLRLGARHDLDHGQEAQAARKHEQVGDVYKDLSGLTVPLRPGDWIRAQTTLYSRLCGMLAGVRGDRDD